MLFLDALIRFSAITVLVLLAIAAIRDVRPARCWPYLALASISTAALFLNLSSGDLAPRGAASIIAGYINVPHFVFVWLFGLSVFETDFELRPWHVLAGLVYSIPIGWYRAFQFEWMVQPPVIVLIAVSLGTIVLISHLAWTILKEKQSDLLNRRKRARTVFVVMLVLAAVLTAVVDAFLVNRTPDHGQLLKAACIWPAVGAAALWILRSSPESFAPTKSPVDFSQVRSEVNAKDRTLLEQLHERITHKNVYLNPDLTIADLAKDLGVTRHRLRNLINHYLGYENFNQFLNTFRIEAIQRRLDDPALHHVPILTLALEGGFGSIAPFNKAFKARIGITPSEYRRRRREVDQANAIS